MKFYAGTSIRYMTVFLAALAAGLAAAFWIYRDLVGFRQPALNYSLFILLLVIVAALLQTANLFFRVPSFVVESDRVLWPKFPVGQCEIPKSAIKSIRQAYLALAPMIEIEYQSGSRTHRVMLAIDKNQHAEVFRQLGQRSLA